MSPFSKLNRSSQPILLRKKNLSVPLPIIDSLDFPTPMPILEKPILVYTRRCETDVHPPPPSVETIDPPPPSISPSDNILDDLPIALRKGKRTCTTHPIA